MMSGTSSMVVVTMVAPWLPWAQRRRSAVVVVPARSVVAVRAQAVLRSMGAMPGMSSHRRASGPNQLLRSGAAVWKMLLLHVGHTAADRSLQVVHISRILGWQRRQCQR